MFRVSKNMVLAAAVALLLPAKYSEWIRDADESVIHFSGTHAGAEFTGQFEDWTSEIRYDLEAMEDAHVVVEVATGSAVTGNGLYDGTLKGDDWFDVANHPKAVFEAKGFTKTGDLTYATEGTLTIKDQSKPIKLDFTLDITGGVATMTATHTLDRLEYGLGVRSDAAASWVSKDIELKINLLARGQ